tara:strand:- start:1389 stop:2669 length:1281 start_codon:yes stop_codon:yes gene_type:complete
MKFRLADIVGGAAASLDKRLSEDMRRTDERAENTAKERIAKRKERDAKDAEFDAAMTSYAEQIQAAMGPGYSETDAVRIIKDYGGNLAGAERAAKAFTESQDAGINVGTLVKFTQGTDSATLPELIRSLRPSATTMQPLAEGEVTGTGFLKGVDLSSQINKQVPIDAQTRESFDIGTATIDRSKLAAGILGQQKLNPKEKDGKNGTYKAMHVNFTQQIMEEMDKPVAQRNQALINDLEKKRGEALKQWYEFQVDEGGATNDQGSFDKKLLSSASTIIKDAVNSSQSKFRIKGVGGEIQTVISGNEGEAYDLERESLRNIKSTAYKDTTKFAMLHGAVDGEIQRVNARINAFKQTAKTKYLTNVRDDADYQSDKFIDLTQSDITPEQILQNGMEGMYRPNTVVEYIQENRDGQKVKVMALWTGYKFI